MLHYIINLIIFIPITIILIIASIKLTKFNSDNINKHKYVKVLERTNLNKDTSIFVLEMGDEGCVLASSPSKTEKIKVLSKEEIAQIYDMKESYGIDLSQIDVDKFNISNFGLKNDYASEIILEGNKKNKKNMFSKKNKSKFSNFNNSDRLLFNKK